MTLTKKTPPHLLLQVPSVCIIIRGIVSQQTGVGNIRDIVPIRPLKSLEIQIQGKTNC